MADVNLSTTESLAIHETDSISSLAKATSTTLVEYLIANETIFPSGYDIAAVAGGGVTMRERSLTDNWLALHSKNCVISGLVIPASSLSLSLTMPVGTALLAGRYLDIPATTLTFSPSIMSWIYLKVTRDVALNVTGAWYEVNTTGTAPADSTPIARAVTSIGAVTSTTDVRLLGAKVATYQTPLSTGAGSNIAHEGSVTISASQALNDLHYYTDFTLNVAQTLTISDLAHRLILVAANSITINGTIDGIGAGGVGGNGGASGGGAGLAGGTGYVSAGGNGGFGGAGGGLAFGIRLSSPLDYYGGGGGGGGAGSAVAAGGAGGRGGASIVLIAHTVVLGPGAVLNTSGLAGSNAGGGDASGGGGGGAGYILIVAQQYRDGGATMTLSGGAGGSKQGVGAAGSAGSNGVKQINLY